MRGGIEVARLVAVIDQDQKSPTKPAGGIADPLDRAQIDLRPPSRLQRDVEPREVRGERRRRRRTFNRRQSAFALDDEHFTQPVFAHHDLMDRQRIEELVGDQHALERLGQGR